MDVDDIPLGVDFTKYIDEKVGMCEVLLAVVGRDWLSVTDEDGVRRLDKPGDFVRLELESALRRNIPVVPLLVRRASMPKAKDLPESIREFSRRNGMPVRADPDFRTDCDRLIEGLERDRTGKRPIISSHKESVATKPKPKRKHKALLLGVAGIAVISALTGFFIWYSGRLGAAPGIVSFLANPDTIQQGAATTLSWRTKNARKVSIQPDIGTVATSGTRRISPTRDTAYTLVASGSGNRSVKRRLSIKVIQSQPVAVIPRSRLSVTDNTLELGKSTTLSWRTRGATEVEIQPDIGRVEENGSVKIAPRRTTTYTLTAKSPAGTATSTTLVKVENPVSSTNRTILIQPALRLTR